jgi:hypothetical protein
VANPLWGAPRIHGELLKLGMEVGQTTVAKCMAKRRQPPSQGGRTFVRNHADAIASIDMFVVPTISFRLLDGLLIVQQSRRELLWLARQLTEACGWDEPPRYSIRDRDGIWRCLHPAHPGHGHSRPAGLDAIALAERICGEAARQARNQLPQRIAALS